MSKEHFKNQAARLATHLANRHGVKLRPAATLEAVAALHGARDWNTLAAGPYPASPLGPEPSAIKAVSPGESLFQKLLASGTQSFSLWVVAFNHPLKGEPEDSPVNRVKVRELQYSTDELRITALLNRDIGSDLCTFLEHRTQLPPVSFEPRCSTLGEFEYEFAGEVFQVQYRSTGRGISASIEVEFVDRRRKHRNLEISAVLRAQPHASGELHVMPAGVAQGYCYSVARKLGVTDIKWAGAKWTEVSPTKFGQAELWFVSIDTPEDALACEALVLAGHRVLARVAGKTAPEAIEQLKQWGLGADRLEKVVCGVWGMHRIEP